jgi:hypothetical protein
MMCWLHPLWCIELGNLSGLLNSRMTGLVIASKLDTESQMIFENIVFQSWYVDSFYIVIFLRRLLSQDRLGKLGQVQYGF